MKSAVLFLFFAHSFATLVGLWTLDEAKGYLAWDSSEAQNHAVFLNGAAGWHPKEGLIDGAYNFQADNCGVIQNMIPNDFTIAFWMKTYSSGNSGDQWWDGTGLVDGEVAGSLTDFGVSLMSRKIAFGLGPRDFTIFSTSAVNDNTWRHVAVTRSAVVNVTNTISIFIDGLKETTATIDYNTEPRADTPAINFGCTQTGNQRNKYTGYLDQIRIYSHVVAETEIKSIYTAEKSGKQLATVSGAPTRLAADTDFDSDLTEHQNSIPAEAMAIIFGVIFALGVIALAGAGYYVVKHRIPMPKFEFKHKKVGGHHHEVSNSLLDDIE
jgi:hypothetical protein